METTGTIHVIFETKQVSERFTKREFVIEIAENPKYPQLVQFQATGDRCSQLDGLNDGDKVRVEFNLRGRKWDGPNGTKYFTTLEAWKIVPAQDKKSAGAPQVAPSEDPPDDLPFASADMASEPNPIARILR